MNTQEQLEALKDIRQIMNRSVRFLSLSGLSGVFAGLYACVAAGIAYVRMGNSFVYDYSMAQGNLIFFIVLAVATLVLAVVTSYILTYQKAKKTGTKIWDATAWRALVNFGIPLFTGGLFGLALIKLGLFGLVPPVTLVFYGLAVVNVSSHSIPELRGLGLLEIILGLLNMLFIGYGLLFWVVGFGILHIIYGVYMYFKYDRQ